MTEKDKEYDKHMTESQFRHEVLKSIDYWRKKSIGYWRNEIDFDSTSDYAEWLWECVGNISIYVAMLRSI